MFNAFPNLGGTWEGRGKTRHSMALGNASTNIILGRGDPTQFAQPYTTRFRVRGYPAYRQSSAIWAQTLDTNAQAVVLSSPVGFTKMKLRCWQLPTTNMSHGTPQRSRPSAHNVEAVAVVAKLVKKMSENEPAENPSAFVTKGCPNAMHINKLFDNCLRQRLRASLVLSPPAPQPPKPPPKNFERQTCCCVSIRSPPLTAAHRRKSSNVRCYRNYT